MVTYDCQPLREHARQANFFFFEQNTKNQGLFYIPWTPNLPLIFIHVEITKRR